MSSHTDYHMKETCFVFFLVLHFKLIIHSNPKVLALVGDQLDYGENICGAVLSIRFNEDILSVWNRNAADHQAVMALRDAIKRQLKLPQETFGTADK
ncbi:hypothetical protein C5167_021185 [Papaver somniferum]|uniref:mRNA cap-binding protein n=1 Tax=Papaver somniferum TaxID=3469 RepID=A0A4Y7IZ36_PAPSO|nr:hypothetical protein C5167_021185 [Papaver somniferum]